MNKLPITAFVVSKNEGHLLSACLESLYFCDEIIVINLKSTDNTQEIAERFDARIITIEPEPFLEIIHTNHIGVCSNKWVLITDPDEVTTPELAADITNNFNEWNNSSDIGAIDAPIIYYFRNNPLRGTSWGGVKLRTYLIHRERFKFTAMVHNGRKLLDGYKRVCIVHNGKNHIRHYWMSGFRQIYTKHKRYLKGEGKSKFESGMRTSIFEIIKTPFRQFFYSFVYARGFKDGFTGLFLSFFRSWYFSAVHIELYKYQKKQLSISNKQQP
ncbi:glycosyltransferase [Flavobacterium sp. 3HN19-14]|uniref:glycosyltransferase n=1 Tax=Flavobacterium sp. 3HN19-14 TaxID=3448133 RepID=UPI003EDF0ABC